MPNKQLMLEDYQQEFISLIIKHKRFGVFLRVGAGKTLIMLESLRILFNQKKVKKVLILAPKHVIHNAWVAEIKKWSYDFTYHIATGQGLKFIKTAQIYIATNDVTRSKFYKNFLVTVCPDCIVVDESSKYRNFSSKRTKNLLKTCLKMVTSGNTVLGYAYRTNRLYLLSATPAPNHIQNLFTQALLLDGGNSLGVTLTRFREDYMRKSGSRFHQYQAKEQKLNELFHKMRYISRSCKLMHFKKPRLVYTNVAFDTKEKKATFKKQYDLLKDHCLVNLQTDHTFSEENMLSFNVLAKFIKLRQICSGILYEQITDAVGNSEIKKHFFDSPKLDALVQLIDDLEGRPLLVGYNFTLECEAIEERLHSLKLRQEKITGQMGVKKVSDIIDRWNNKQFDVLLGHPSAMGHGLNLQTGGSDMLWYSPPLDYELYVQMNGRLDRKGQTEQVIIRHFQMANTIEPIIYQSLSNKELLLSNLLHYIKQ